MDRSGAVFVESSARRNDAVDQIRQALHDLPTQVTLVSYTSDVESWYAVVGETDPGIHYYGLPDGYELETFLGIIRAVPEQRPGLAPRTVDRLRALTAPVHLEVFASPT
jgi:alkyl hydroperoxide reductase subunit AhpF